MEKGAPQRELGGPQREPGGPQRELAGFQGGWDEGKEKKHTRPLPKKCNGYHAYQETRPTVSIILLYFHKRPSVSIADHQRFPLDKEFCLPLSFLLTFHLSPLTSSL